MALTTFAQAIFPNNLDANHKAVGRLANWNGSQYVTTGSGVAISPRWVIAVSHVGGSFFEQDGVIYPVLQKIAHTAPNMQNADLAVFEIGGPMRYALPMSFRPWSGPGGIQGDTATLVGYGETGTRTASGWSIQAGSSGTRRWANNAIDHIDVVQVMVGPNLKTSVCVFYDLDDPLGQNPVNVLGGTAVPNEGGIASWDSGGGWIVQDNLRPRVLAASAYVGTFPGSGVPNWWSHGGVGMAVYFQPYKLWIEATVPDLGVAILDSVAMENGDLLGGSVASLNAADNIFLRTRSLNLVESEVNFPHGFIVSATTTASPAATMDVTFKGLVDSIGAPFDLSLRNWNTSFFEIVGTGSMSSANTTYQFLGIPAGNYVSTSGRIDARLRVLGIADEAVFFHPDIDFWQMKAR